MKTIFGGSGIYRLTTETIGYISKTDNRYPNPIFKYNISPCQIVPRNQGFYLKVPSSIPDNSTIHIVSNKYAEIDKIYRSIDIQNINDRKFIDIKPPNTDNLFAYTAYYKDENNKLTYIGESCPLKKTDDSIVKEYTPAIPLSNKSRRVMNRYVRRGYYKIQINARTWYPISQQMFLRNKKLPNYRSAQKYAQNAKIADEFGKLIVNSLNITNEFDFINFISKMVQFMEWKSDVKTENEYEYIRSPTNTIANMFGDCDDKLILINGLLENTMNIDTCILLAPEHVLTGINIESLSDKTIDTIKRKISNRHIATYKGKNNEYIPVESTGYDKIGTKVDRKVYGIYKNGQYQIINPLYAINHLKQTIESII